MDEYHSPIAPEADVFETKGGNERRATPDVH